MNHRCLVPVDWPAPRGVRAFSTTRAGGVSRGPFASLNLSAASGDAAARVAENQARLVRAAALPQPPAWPRQVHGTRAVATGEAADGAQADAVFASAPQRVCAVRTADCLPVLLCDLDASCVAAAHAGWRGLAAGVLEATIAALPVPSSRLMAWLGPAIGPAAYEVGEEVRAAFLAADAGCAACFAPSPAGRWLADLFALARRRLAGAGVTRVHGGGVCTYAEPARFFSYRRDGVTGRMASGAWLEARA